MRPTGHFQYERNRERNPLTKIEPLDGSSRSGRKEKGSVRTTTAPQAPAKGRREQRMADAPLAGGDRPALLLVNSRAARAQVGGFCGSRTDFRKSSNCNRGPGGPVRLVFLLRLYQNVCLLVQARRSDVIRATIGLQAKCHRFATFRSVWQPVSRSHSASDFRWRRQPKGPANCGKPAP